MKIGFLIPQEMTLDLQITIDYWLVELLSVNNPQAKQQVPYGS